MSLNQTFSKGTFLLLLSEREGSLWWYFTSSKTGPEVPVDTVSTLLV